MLHLWTPIEIDIGISYCKKVEQVILTSDNWL